MEIAERVVVEARAWIGTPYVHQASCRGAGSDCLGLVRGIWRAVHGQEPCGIPVYSADWEEFSNGDPLLEALQRYLLPKPLAEAERGDVLLFRMRERGIAKHLGIQSAVTPMPRFIHAYSGHSVTDSALSTPWARRICGRFTFPAGAD